MELNEFVKESLVQIARGVHDAQKDVRALGGVVNPATDGASHQSDFYFATIDRMHHVFLVNFDVAVEASEATGVDAEGRLSVATIFKLGAGGKSSHANSSTNRIAFKVPLALPIDEASQDKLCKKLDRAKEIMSNQNSEFRRP